MFNNHPIVGEMIVIVLLAQPIAKMWIKPPLRGGVRLSRVTKMPFANEMGRVANFFQVFGENTLRKWEAFCWPTHNHVMLQSCSLENF